MQNIAYQNRKFFLAGVYLALAASVVAVSGCKKDKDKVEGTNFQMVNLVASSSQFSGARVDPNLVNGWGIAFSSTGNAWLSSQGKGLGVVYSATGAELLPAVSIPTASGSTGGQPTGIVFNSSSNFVIPGGSAAKFIFAGTDGVISGWSTGGAAQKIVDKSATSAYTGLALATNGSSDMLYAANFKLGKIDVFDNSFNEMTMTFTDPTMPAGYAPFNIQNVHGQLYVTYAKVDASDGEEEKGAGLGYVDVYNPNGSFVKRLASQGGLNAPWGVAAAPSGFFNGSDNETILVGNFGDGNILAYSSDGNFLGKLRSNGSDLKIDGLWGIAFAPSSATGVDPNKLFFAAGPDDEQQGLYGYITK